MSYHEANAYIDEAIKQKRRDIRDTTILAYSMVVWNRVEPKYIPSIEDVVGEDVAAESKPTQTVQEQVDILQSFAVRSRAVGRGLNLGKKT